MRVFSLIGQNGSFETSPEGQPLGYRTFGFWSGGLQVSPGDLVVIQRETHNACYIIRTTEGAPFFTGSDDNTFWRGTMQDVVEHKLLTREIIDALKRAGP